MVVELSHFALIIAFAFSLLVAAIGLWGGHSRNLQLINGTNGAVNIAFAAISLSFLGLVYSHLVSDFSVKNVVENSHTLKPLIYKISGTWGNHEGSMLLWVLVALGFAFSLVKFEKNLAPTIKARALGIQGLISASIIAYILFASNPFARLIEPPFQGNDLNPLLQDPALSLHPPFLYLGYVGLSLVYSLAIAGLLEGSVDAVWARLLRPWVLASWTFLTIGIALGSYWAYYELGWGGWWFWDPVENASFMPWLLASALLHSAIVTEKRGALAAWTVLLSILAFSLSLLGTFLVRSGVLTSVHAFALDPERGIFILVILGLFTGGGLLLFGLKGAIMGSDKGIFAIFSRESTLVLNNLFLVVATFTILMGTLYPLLGEAIYGRAISVGAPYFNAVFTPLMSIILLFMPIATFFTWKRTKPLQQMKKLIFAFAIAIMLGVVTAIFAKDKPMSAVGIALGIWLILGALQEVSQKIGIGKINVTQSLKRFDNLRPSHIGMLLAHFGVGVFVIGAVIQTNFSKEETLAIGINESVKFANYTITLKDLTSEEGPNYYSDRAIIDVSAGNAKFTLSPERRYYPAAKMPTTEVDRKTHGFGEIYLALGEASFATGQPKWTVRAYYNNFIGWVFGGSLIIAIGGLFSLSDRGLRIGAPIAPQKPKTETKGEVA
jgi:cytochrome c-type biogenesis protein CcmF